MAKKISYNTKSSEDLKAEYAKLKATFAELTRKIKMGKDIKEYRTVRKNIARILTALNAQDSTKEQK